MPSLLFNALYTAEQTRMIDRIAIEDYSIAGEELMDRAGYFAFTVLTERWPDARHIAVVCGIGNNGGDGYVVARLAHEAGYEVSVLQLGDVKKHRQESANALSLMRRSGLDISTFEATQLAQADIIVDAIFGTGLDRDVNGIWKSAIESINACAIPCVSLDIPSGLHADTGAILGVAIQAEITTAFVGKKRGFYTGQGPDRCGEIYFSDLQIPRDVYDRVRSQSKLITEFSVKSLLGRRSRCAHKGQHGHVLFIGGNHGMSGAIRLAGEAALRCGAGLVSIATRSDHATMLAMSRPELMVHGVETPEALSTLLQKATVVAIGPGLGGDKWSDMVRHIAMQSNLPMVVDADALNLLAQQPRYNAHWVLTPHPGEAARLLQCDTATIEQNRFAAAAQLHKRYGGVVVLKGAGSIVCESDSDFRVCGLGNPGMASGGMGDVLTGTVAALIAQGSQLVLSMMDVVSTSVTLHAWAGDEAAREKGERGIIASDLLPYLQQGVNQ